MKGNSLMKKVMAAIILAVVTHSVQRWVASDE
jgi:hypothetical protein